jgi:LPXTG-motif cell wall-anchored protein
MRGSLGYIVEEHPVLIVVGAMLLLVAVWLLLKRVR